MPGAGDGPLAMAFKAFSLVVRFMMEVRSDAVGLGLEAKLEEEFEKGWGL